MMIDHRMSLLSNVRYGAFASPYSETLNSVYIKSPNYNINRFYVFKNHIFAKTI